jgi:hypothetical protein
MQICYGSRQRRLPNGQHVLTLHSRSLGLAGIPSGRDEGLRIELGEALEGIFNWGKGDLRSQVIMRTLPAERRKSGGKSPAIHLHLTRADRRRHTAHPEYGNSISGDVEFVPDQAITSFKP